MFDESTINEIKRRLCAKGHTIAVAESVTGGLLQSAFASAEEASQFFQGGISAYNVGQKVKHLQVEPIHAIKYNCVSPKIAREMALQICTMFHSDWGISITGYAAPVPESDNHLFAYYTLVCKGEILEEGKLEPVVTDPMDVKLYYVNALLKKLTALILV